MKRCATSCAGMSVHIERMIAMSSTHSPSFGKTSLTSMPALPIFVNLNGDGYASPSCPGIVLSAYSPAPASDPRYRRATVRLPRKCE